MSLIKDLIIHEKIGKLFSEAVSHEHSLCVSQENNFLLNILLSVGVKSVYVNGCIDGVPPHF